MKFYAYIATEFNLLIQLSQVDILVIQHFDGLCHSIFAEKTKIAKNSLSSQIKQKR